MYRPNHDPAEATDVPAEFSGSYISCELCVTLELLQATGTRCACTPSQTNVYTQFAIGLFQIYILKFVIKCDVGQICLIGFIGLT